MNTPITIADLQVISYALPGDAAENPILQKFYLNSKVQWEIINRMGSNLAFENGKYFWWVRSPGRIFQPKFQETALWESIETALEAWNGYLRKKAE